MEILIHLKCKKPDKDYKAALDTYVKRISYFGKVKVVYYKKENIPAIALGSKCFIVRKSNDTVSSEAFSEMLNNCFLNGFSKLEFIVPDGFDIQNIENENVTELNFSSFDMNNELLAVALLEQIYRAFTILNHITYHK